jgi:hypothetical protein
MVVFIWYIGNNDTSAVYPKSLRVNRKNALEALLWLKKHNPFYSYVSIREDNLEWMQGEDEVSIASNAEKFKTKNSKQFQIIASELNMYQQLKKQIWIIRHKIVLILTLQQCMQINLIPCQEETMHT